MRIIDRDTIREIIETIGSNKRRSVATAFGIFWGILMLIVLLSFSNGIRNGLRGVTDNFAPNMLLLSANKTSIAYDGLSQGRVWKLRLTDLHHAKSLMSEINIVAGNRSIYLGDGGASYTGKSVSTTLFGVTENYFDAYQVTLLKGRMLYALDHQEARKDCLLGEEMAQRLFSQHEDPIGKVIQTSMGFSLTVVGIIKERSRFVTVGNRVDHCVVLPLSTLNMYTGRGDQGLSVGLVTYKAGTDKPLAKEKMLSYLKQVNRVAPKDNKAIYSFDVDEVLGFIGNLNTGIGILVWLVGIGTLITGIVGISNILLVVVKERTQEIGVRRAIGAKPKDIITQLLLESLTLTLIAGLLGIMLGVGIMSVVAQGFTKMDNFPFINPTVELGTVLMALSILIVSGLVAGLIPAIKAIEIKAIEAIREE